MTLTTNKERCLFYLKKYAEKDLAEMEKLFSQNIKLRDWKICVIGKERALTETRNNFMAADSIDIEVLALYENSQTIAAELKIVVNEIEELYVVDVISFDAGGKITAIHAYLGRGDD